jgi:hypothetical protein
MLHRSVEKSVECCNGENKMPIMLTTSEREASMDRKELGSFCSGPQQSNIPSEVARPSDGNRRRGREVEER